MRHDDAEWDAWRPEQAAARLAGVEAPWCVVGGWAIDLFLGMERRPHDDLEIAVPADRFHQVAAALGELEFHVVTRGHVELVEEARKLMPTTHQTWGLDPAARTWRIDVFREPSAGGCWIARRESSIRLPYSELIEHTEDGIPYVRPEVALLFKAKQARPKDESDLAAVLPRLGAARKRLLAQWIALVHPGHFWLPDLV